MKSLLATARALCLGLLASTPLLAVQEPAPHGKAAKPLANFDSRMGGAGAPKRPALSAATASSMRQQAASITRGLSTLKATIPSLEVTRSPLTGGVELLGSPTFLTKAAPGRSGADIVRDFYATNTALFGLSGVDLAQLHVIGESVSPSGLRMVRIEQRIGGIPVFQSETRVTLSKDGRIARLIGLFVPNATAAVRPASNPISAKTALVAAMRSVSIAVDEDQMSLTDSTDNGARVKVVANNAAISGKVSSERVYFLAGPGTLVAAWSQVTFTKSDAWYTIVDAETGALLWRKNIEAHSSTQAARFGVYVQADGKTPADSPAPLSPNAVAPGDNTQPPKITRTNVNMLTVQSLPASPNGWIADNGTTTTGNNVDAYLDRDGDDAPDTGVLDNDGRPVGNVDANLRNRDFLGTGYVYAPPPTGPLPGLGTAPTNVQHQRGIVTQLFYVANWYHDQVHALGFDEGAGNFQQVNFGTSGVGGDPVLAEAQDDAANPPDGTNRSNANFATPPDGESGRMQMYIFDEPPTDRDGALDSEIVIHELTHGLSNRLIGDAAGLTWDIGAAMGEGWSDFFALSLLNQTQSDDPNGKYAAGAWATYKLGGLVDNYVYGIRRFPYSTDNTVNPLTWADVDQTTNDLAGGMAPSPLNFNGNGAMEVHNGGEIWANTLWEVRARIIADPEGANGDVALGSRKALQIVTDGMKMTPINPSFTEARDAILLADLAANEGANEASIWEGFADRGLGYNAYVPNKYQFGPVSSYLGVKESFDVPYLDVQSVTVDDAIGNGNDVLDPNEPSKLVVVLKNPWGNPSKDVTTATAVLTSSTPGVVITTDNSTYDEIPPLGSAAGSPFQITVPPGATAGQTISFTITVTSALGTRAVDFKLRVGTPGEAGDPVTYTQVSGLAIPDNAPTGVVDTLAIADDLDIMDVDFRIDSLTHTFAGDLGVMLKGPTGYGAELLAWIGGAVDNGAGDNIVNLTLDDQSSNDGLLLLAEADAPYTGTFKPVFNQAEWAAVGFGPPDPVGQLSRFNNTSSLGDWKVLVSDSFAADSGTLDSWSLIITPRTYTVSPYSPPEITVEEPAGTDLTSGAAASAFGSVAVGSSSASRTYTITNLGTASVDLTGIVVTRTGSTDFVLDTTGTASSLGPNTSTTFAVTFVPTSLGPKVGGITIASNDADENPFEISLSGTGLAAPAVVTGAATAVTESGATLNGTVNPEGLVTTVVFDYGLRTTYGSQVPGAPSPGTGLSAVPVSADIAGLSCGTTYHFRVSATNPGGTSHGSDETFATPACVGLSVDDPSVIEGSSGFSILAFTISLSSPSGSDVTVDFATSNGTATAGSDYTAANGTFTIPAGYTSKKLAVLVHSDASIEGDEELTLTLSNAVGAPIGKSTGSGRIVDDDPAAPATRLTYYRLYHDGTKEHLYTTDLNEYNALGSGGWNQEGSIGGILTSGTYLGVQTIPVFRLYHPGTQQHLWTTDSNEALVLSRTPDWQYEGGIANLLPTPVTGAIPLYRMNLASPPIHLWTTDQNEYDTLATRGWTPEGIIGYLIP